MMTSLEIVFWSSAGLIVYVYALYPLLVWALSRTVTDPARRCADANNHTASLRKKSSEQGAATDWPMVSVIIAAYKEEGIILQRLLNAVLMDYPVDRVEIIVGCDGAEDLTGELVGTFTDSRVRLVQFPQRRGKASVLNDCVPLARGEIIAFSDANTMFDGDALKKLVRHFRDASVGGVCGKLILTDAVTGENADGMYWRYENFIKRAEARLGVLLGFNGAIYAIRKELYQPIPTQTIIDDFLIGMRIHLAEMKVIYDDSAIAREETAPHVQAEFHRRARIGAGGFQSLMWLSSLLHPRHGLLSWAFWSHKVLRWFCPLFMASALFANVALMNEQFYVRMLLAHELFYLTAMFGLSFATGRRWQKGLKLQALFVSVNAALLVGFWRWFRGIRSGTWKRTDRVVPQGAVPAQATTNVSDKAQLHEVVS
ncbi:MAG: glycosyltransferase family 2 protein [Planctomycetaceae bacterium]